MGDRKGRFRFNEEELKRLKKADFWESVRITRHAYVREATKHLTDENILNLIDKLVLELDLQDKISALEPPFF